RKTAMDRRQFLIATSVASFSGAASLPLRAADGPGFASPAEAIKAPRETLLYVIGLYGNGARKPDYLACVDVDAKSPTYSRIIHRLSMSSVGDELHHFGWNTC